MSSSRPSPSCGTRRKARTGSFASETGPRCATLRIHVYCSLWRPTLPAMSTAIAPAANLRSKPRRENIPPGTVLCEHCPAKCCRYFALPIDEPSEYTDYEFIRWFLLHEHATVFVEDGTWYLLVHTKCKHLGADNRCGIYATRPQICRDYSTENCEY